MNYILIPALVGLVVLFIRLIIPAAGAYDLKKKFRKLGDMKGKSKDELLVVLGPANMTETTNEGLQILTWKAGGYLVALLFDKEGKVNRIVQEVNA